MECLASGILLPGKGFKLSRQKNKKKKILILVNLSKHILNVCPLKRKMMCRNCVL